MTDNVGALGGPEVLPEGLGWFPRTLDCHCFGFGLSYSELCCGFWHSCACTRWNLVELLCSSSAFRYCTSFFSGGAVELSGHEHIADESHQKQYDAIVRKLSLFNTVITITYVSVNTRSLFTMVRIHITLRLTLPVGFRIFRSMLAVRVCMKPVCCS